MYKRQVLKQEGADDDEIILFTYWVDGICKPTAISEDLGVEVKEILNITKRLKRRLLKVQDVYKRQHPCSGCQRAIACQLPVRRVLSTEAGVRRTCTGGRVWRYALHR